MKKIGKLVAQISDELHDAEKYAEKYIEAKADAAASNDPAIRELANMYHEMSQDELRHSDNLHTMAVAVIDKIRAVYTPSMEMQEKWDDCHTRFINKAAEIKRMLSM